MTRVLGGKPFSHEDVAEMTTAVIAEDFGAGTVRVGHFFDRALDLVVETRPPALADEFIAGTIQRRVATSADIGAGVFQIRILANECPFCAFAEDHTRFCGRDEPIDYYKDSDYGASPPAPDPSEADQYKMEASWLDSLSPYTFEQANTRETSLKILDATNASMRFLKGNPVWSRRVAWITHNAAEAVKKRKAKKVLAFVNILLRPYVEMRLMSTGAVLREPVEVVSKSGESREVGTVPQPVVVEWQRGLDRLRDKLPRRGPERTPILAKIAILEAAVNKQGACCVSPNVLVPPPDPAADDGSVKKGGKGK